MAFDNGKVQKYVDDALGRGLRGKGCCGQIEMAFRDLQSRRRIPGNSLDMELAAAEHYMFSRWQVCSGFVSPTQMRALVTGYDAKKLMDRVTGEPNREQTTTNPVSPPSVDVVNWGLKGVNDGDADRARCNKAADPPLWTPIEKILGSQPKSVY